MDVRKLAMEVPPQMLAGHPAPETVSCWRLLVEDVEYHGIVSRDNVAGARSEPDMRWHVSISGQDAVPPWEVMAAGAHALRPGVPFVMGVPPLSWWLNVHPHVLHLWEFKDEPLVEQWRFERQGHSPS